MSERPKIEADFEVIRVQTMRDSAIRVTLEMPEYMILQMGMFAECQRNGIYLHGEFIAAIKKSEINNDDELKIDFDISDQ
ncbi:MAG: hypothetical protein IMY80_07605 [Chloroflexi bacterium]|nr:hypothetical protein [Chloroflexota bacterium]